MDHSGHGMHDHHHHHADAASDLSATVMTEMMNASAALSNIVKNLTDGHMAHPDHMGHNMDMTTTMDMDHGDMDMGGMSMYFHFGYDETILFKGWAISTVWGLVGSMFAIFCIAVIYEGVKYFREFLFKKSIRSTQLYTAASVKGVPGAPAPRDIPIQYMDQVLLPSALSMWSSGHFIQTILHMIQFVISYCLMLIFMTYNVWLCLACTVGAGIGYFLFGWKKSVVVDVTEHCH